MTAPRELDVSRLPTHAFDERDPMFWGVWGLVAIEGTMFALMAVTYLYIRGNMVDAFPPSYVPGTARLSEAGVLLLLLASCYPVWRSNAAAKAGKLRPMRAWLLLAMVLTGLTVPLRFWTFHLLPFSWDSHAYGSVVWTILGLHAFHLITDTLEDALFVLLFFIGPVEEKHLVDVNVTSYYAYFVVAAYVPLFALIFLDPAGFRT